MVKHLVLTIVSLQMHLQYLDYIRREQETLFRNGFDSAEAPVSFNDWFSLWNHCQRFVDKASSH